MKNLFLTNKMCHVSAVKIQSSGSVKSPGKKNVVEQPEG